jgi:hypothetical protein
MTEQELRTLVRESIARHLGSSSAPPAQLASADVAPGHLRTRAPAHPPSHWLFSVPTGADADGPCVIEPTVTCNHCGYCKSYGH